MQISCGLELHDRHSFVKNVPFVRPGFQASLTGMLHMYDTAGRLVWHSAEVLQA